MSKDSLHLVMTKRQDFSDSEWFAILQELGKIRGMRFEGDTFLLFADTTDLTLKLGAMGNGKGASAFLICPLSLDELANQQGVRKQILRPLLAKHLRAELESLGLKSPPALEEICQQEIRHPLYG
jgi:hypothetical protein